MLPGRGGLEHYYLQPKLTPNVLALPVVGSLGVTLFSFRLTSLLVGILGLIGTYALARQLYDRRLALLAMILLATNFWFFMTARTFRPEIFVMSFTICFASLLLRLLRSPSRILALLTGALLGFAVLTHQMSVPFLVGTTLPIFLIRDRAWPHARMLRRSSLVFLLGVVATLAPYALYVVWAQSTSPASWLDQVRGEATRFAATGLIGKELARWANFLQLPLGTPIATLYLVALVSALRSRASGDRLIGVLVIAQACALALIPLATGRYASILLPYLAILVARFIRSPEIAGWLAPRGLGRVLPTHGRARLVGGIAAAGYFAAMLAGTGALVRAQKGAGYGELVSTMSKHIGPHETVAGPIVFWLGLHKHDYTVTNIPPTFSLDSQIDFAWLQDRLESKAPDVLLQTTTFLQSTGGLEARPQGFDAAPNSVLIDSLTTKHGELRMELPSRDYGPVRIWSLDWRHEARQVQVYTSDSDAGAGRVSAARGATASE
jgi:hypothetical protein